MATNPDVSSALGRSLAAPGGAPRPISGTTRFCAVLGCPVAHSASPAMHNVALRALGLDWRYLAFEVPPADLAAAVVGAKAMRFIGLNLTVPHKLLALECVDELDPAARRWGAVNTVRFEARDSRGGWQPLAQGGEEGTSAASGPAEIRAHGFNTDADAIVRALCEDLGLARLAGRSVLVLGAGGAGRAAALRLADAGVGALFLVNRTPAKAEGVAAEIRAACPTVAVQVGYPREPVDVLLNATSLGLRADDPVPLDVSRYPLELAQAVYDMIYRPAQTPLLRLARAAGCRTANGLGMLLYQGAAALELWTGQPAPVALMRQALEENVYGT